MILGAPWGALGQTSGDPRASWELTGVSLGALGGSRGFPGASLEGPWGPLGGSPGLWDPLTDPRSARVVPKERPGRPGTGAEGPWGDKGG